MATESHRLELVATSSGMSAVNSALKNLENQAKLTEGAVRGVESVIRSLNTTAKSASLATLIANIRSLDANSRTSSANTAALEAQIRNLSSASSSNTIDRMANDVRELEARMTRASNSANLLNANIRGLGGGSSINRINSELRATENQANSTNNSIRSLTASLGGLISLAGTGFVVKGLIETADTMKLLQARLDVATHSFERNTQAMETALEIAQTYTAPLETIAQVYSGVARAGRDLQLSQEGVVNVTKTIAGAMVISGTSVAEAKGALTQFNQAMASGVLRGEEFNSVNEQLPRLMQAIADGFENADGSIGVLKSELRAMANEGALTMDKVIPAIQRGMKKIEEEAARVPVTVGGAWLRVTNAAKIYIADADNASGTTTKLAAAVTNLAADFDKIVKTAETLAFVLAGRLAVGITASTVATVKNVQANTAAIAANVARLQTEQANAVAAARGATITVQVTALTLQRAETDHIAAQAALRLAAGTTAEAAADARLIAVSEVLNAARAQSVLAINAQAAATTAATAATGALSTAQAAASVTSRAMTAAMTFLGSPLGLVVTLLASGAAAWAYFGDEAEKAADKIAKAQERLKKGKGIQEDFTLLDDEITAAEKEIARLEARKGTFVYDVGNEEKDLEQQKFLLSELKKIRADSAIVAARESEIDGHVAFLDSFELLQQIKDKDYRQYIASDSDFLDARGKINAKIKDENDAYKKASEGVSEFDSRFLVLKQKHNSRLAILNKQLADLDKEKNKEKEAAIKKERDDFASLVESLKNEEQVIKEAYDRSVALVKRNAAESAQPSFIAKLDEKLRDDLSKTTAAKDIEKWADDVFKAFEDSQKTISELTATPISQAIKVFEKRQIAIEEVGGGNKAALSTKNKSTLLDAVDKELGTGKNKDAFQQQLDEEQNNYVRQQEMLAEFYSNKESLQEEFRSREQELEKAHQDKLDAIKSARNQLALKSAQDISTSLTDIAKNTAGEQSEVYKTMFAASKAFAIADSAVKISDAIASASMSLPFPANLGAMAVVAAQTASIVSNIQAIELKDTGGLIPSGKSAIVGELGAEIVTGPAYVESRRNSAEKLSKGGGGVVINITNVAGDAQVTKTKETTMQDGTVMVDLLVSKITEKLTQDVQQGGTKFNRMLESRYNLKRGAA